MNPCGLFAASPAEDPDGGVDAADSQRLYAGTNGGGVFRSLDGALNWELASGGVGGGGVQALAINPQASSEILAGIAGGGLFRRKAAARAGKKLARIYASTACARSLTIRHAAPLFFVRGDQINAQVPFEVAGLSEVPVRVVFGETESNRAVVPMLASHPGVFDFIKNQDLTRNSAENPEAPGNVVVLAVTGAGLLSPALLTGQPAPAGPFSAPILPVELTIGGQPAPIDFIGAAPGFVGLIQINARIPLGLAAGEQPVSLRVGGGCQPGPNQGVREVAAGPNATPSQPTNITN